MATAIAGASYQLHVWVRHSDDLESLGDVAHVRHNTTGDLAAACDMVGLCVSSDDDVMEVVTGGLLAGVRPGSVIVNHGIGMPGNAVKLNADLRQGAGRNARRACQRRASRRRSADAARDRRDVNARLLPPDILTAARLRHLNGAETGKYGLTLRAGIDCGYFRRSCRSGQVNPAILWARDVA